MEDSDHKYAIICASDSVICEICSKPLRNQRCLIFHLKKKHQVIGEFACEICNESYSRGDNLKAHRAKCHNIPSCTKKLTKRIICPILTCETTALKNYEDLDVHLSSNHGIFTEVEKLRFKSVTEFENWKTEIEVRTFSKYVLHRGMKYNRQSFFCHRSLFSIYKGKNIRHKRRSSNKLKRACPSRIDVEFGERHVLVSFHKTHVGHTPNIGCVPLHKSTRLEIADKLQQGVSIEHILEDTGDSEISNGEITRDHLIERKDILNIIKDFKITGNYTHYSNDSSSIEIWVEKMSQLGENNPVKYYKKHGSVDPLGQFEDNDLILVIMTPIQCQQLQNFGSDTICIDGTHGNNGCNLFTVMTVDELGSGCPVAFYYGNRVDETILVLFFSVIKHEVGVLTPNIFMSDDAPAFYNAWSSVMSTVEHRLLCAWNVDISWRTNLRKISGGVEKKATVYKSLRTILQITDEMTFNEELTQVVSELIGDPDTLQFGRYFQKCYADCPQTWAHCYRIGLGIDTNTYLESLHKKLKYFYLNDEPIHALLSIARDSLYQRVFELSKNNLTEKIQEIMQSHETSIAIIDDMIICHQGESCIVTASSSQNTYTVTRLSDFCCTDCPLTCDVCDICVHAFTCTCYDNVINLNICKHIHACQRLVYINYSSIHSPAAASDGVSESEKTFNSSDLMFIKKDDIKIEETETLFSQVVLQLKQKYMTFFKDESKCNKHILDLTKTILNGPGAAVVKNKQVKQNIQKKLRVLPKKNIKSEGTNRSTTEKKIKYVIIQKPPPSKADHLTKRLTKTTQD